MKERKYRSKKNGFQREIFQTSDFTTDSNVEQKQNKNKM